MKIKIPLININLFIYFGKKGLKKFTKEIHKDNENWKPEKRIGGYSAKNYIWIYKKKRNIIYHELSHFFDWLYQHLDCEKEYEFKAYLHEYTIKEINKKF